MKSVANVALVAAAGILTLIGIYSLTLSYESQTVVRDFNERIIVEGINQMEFVKRAINQALIYSAYQGTYETLKYGGYSTGEICEPIRFANLPFWRTFEKTCPPGKLENDLTQILQGRFNEYLSSLRKETEKINIEIPQIEVKVDKLASVSIKPVSESKIKFTSKNIEISDIPDVNEVVKLNVKVLVDKANENFVARDSINDAIEFSEQQMPSECKSIVESKCFSPPTPLDKKSNLEQKCPNALNQYENLIKQNIGNLDSQLDSTNIDVILKIGVNSYVDNEGQCQLDVDSNGCGCSPMGGCIPLYTKTCTYDYSSSVGALVNIKDKQNLYPVYDTVQKTTNLRNLEMNFYVLSGDKLLGFPSSTPVFEVPLHGVPEGTPPTVPQPVIVPGTPLDLDIVFVGGGTSGFNYNIANREADGTDIKYIVVHTCEGGYQACINALRGSTRQVSAHYVISKTGKIAQVVSDKDIAFHAGYYDYNVHSIGIEHEGRSGDPSTWTPEMLQASATLTKWLATKYNIPIDRSHIIGHNEVPGCPVSGGGGSDCHTDPGAYLDWDGYINLINGIQLTFPV